VLFGDVHPSSSHLTVNRTQYKFGTIVPFALLHLGCLAVFFIPLRREWLLLAACSYLIRMFGVTAGYHRYFSHRTYKLNRFWQFAMAFLAETSGQKGVLWWGAHHRVHHRNSDRETDVHSPRQSGFWWAHVGWVISNRYDEFEPQLIQDFSKFPELRWLDRNYWFPPAVLGAVTLAFGVGPFVWAFVVPTVLLFHGTFLINSLAHVWGTRRYDTPDDSRNNFVLALVTLGEGWHNNHHQFMYACRQGIRWWEVDITYYVLRLLNWLGIAQDLREVKTLRSEESVA
jgi:stearoyl-CoA desaturase (delta-9 desaturase)